MWWNDNRTMKVLTVAFTRNPKFTPASLTDKQLARIELVVKCAFSRHLAKVNNGMEEVTSGREQAEYLSKKYYHNSLYKWLTGDSAKYFSSCWNYLLAIAKNNREIVIEEHNRAYYAERRNGYN